MARYRCASHEATGMEAFMAAWSALTQHGTWPVEGGLYAQSPWFVQAAQVADAEKGRLESDEIAKARKGQGQTQGAPQRPLTVQPAQPGPQTGAPVPGSPAGSVPTRLSGPVRRP